MHPLIQIVLGMVLLVTTLSVQILVVHLSLKHIGDRIAVTRVHKSIYRKTNLVLNCIILLSFALLTASFIWAFAFLMLDAVDGFWQGVYFSIVTLTTLGYGDLVPPEGAELVAALCAIAGLFLVGLSTAFVVEILRSIEVS